MKMISIAVELRLDVQKFLKTLGINCKSGPRLQRCLFDNHSIVLVFIIGSGPLGFLIVYSANPAEANQNMEPT